MMGSTSCHPLLVTDTLQFGELMVLMGATALKGGAEVSSMGSPFKEKFDPQKAMALGLKAGQNTVNYSL